MLRAPQLPPAARCFSASALPSGAPAAAAEAPPPFYAPAGRVEAPYKLQPRDVFAVVQAGTHQFKVTIDDLIYVEKLSGVDVNDKVRA